MESGDWGAAGDSGIARPAPRKDDEEDCEASAQDLGMLRELRNRPHLLRGEEPEDELRDVPVCPHQAPHKIHEEDWHEDIHARWSAVSHFQENEDVVFQAEHQGVALGRPESRPQSDREPLDATQAHNREDAGRQEHGRVHQEHQNLLEEAGEGHGLPRQTHPLYAQASPGCH